VTVALIRDALGKLRAVEADKSSVRGSDSVLSSLTTALGMGDMSDGAKVCIHVSRFTSISMYARCSSEPLNKVCIHKYVDLYLRLYLCSDSVLSSLTTALVMGDMSDGGNKVCIIISIQRVREREGERESRRPSQSRRRECVSECGSVRGGW